jgi:hypothetical protein
LQTLDLLLLCLGFFAEPFAVNHHGVVVFLTYTAAEHYDGSEEEK